MNADFDVIVVGGGASGMIAAGRAAERGKRVLLLEKNKRLGEKLRITGGGRCNIANAEFDDRALLRHYGKAEQFLYSPFSQFGVKDTFAFFESKGLPLVVQEKKRVFPQTERASDVVRVLEEYIRKNKVMLQLDTLVREIITDGKRSVLGVKSSRGEYRAYTMILSSGGFSHPETGSTGDGFDWLGKLGHTVQVPTPTLVPLAVREQWAKKLSGVALAKAGITFFVNGKKQFSKTGEILFTHFGLSGPCVLNSAAKVSDLLHEGVVTAEIDITPDVDLRKLEAHILDVFERNKNKLLKNMLKEFMPSAVVAPFVEISKKISEDGKVHSVTKEQRREIAKLMKCLPVTITNLLGYDRAIVVDGGAVLEEIDTRSMRSKLYDNLYITGDLLHVNRPSGGYSLQLCWTTGYVAGSHAGEELRDSH